MPFIEYVWAIGNWEFYLDFQTIANWQLVLSLDFGRIVWISSNRQLGILSGFQCNQQSAFRLDFEQSVVGEFYPKMYQKRIPKRASKNRCFPLKTVVGLQNLSKTRSQTPLKIEYKSPLILESLKFKNKQTLQTFPHFFRFKIIKNNPNTFPKAVLDCLSAFDNRTSCLDIGAIGN